MYNRAAEFVTLARLSELSRMESAVVVVAARIGLRSLPTRCRMDNHGVGLDVRHVLHVDGSPVWECWWREDPTHVYTIQERWLTDPERLSPQSERADE